MNIFSSEWNIILKHDELKRKNSQQQLPLLM